MTERLDEELLRAYRGGHDASGEELLSRYKGLVLRNAKSLFLVGGDQDDLIQEGMMGVFSAMLTYREDRGASFRTFANLCIRRQMLKAIESSGTKKHMPLNTALSLNLTGEGEGVREADLPEALNPSPEDPLQILLDDEVVERLLMKIRKSLSPMEEQVLSLHLDGLDYLQIADCMGREPKSIDNALQRIRGKVRRELEDNQS